MENLGPVIFDASCQSQSQNQNLENISVSASGSGGVVSEQVLDAEDVDIDSIVPPQTTTLIQFGANFDFPRTPNSKDIENVQNQNQNIFVNFVEEMSNTEPVSGQMVSVVGLNSILGEFDQPSFDVFQVGDSSEQNQAQIIDTDEGIRFFVENVSDEFTIEELEPLSPTNCDSKDMMTTEQADFDFNVDEEIASNEIAATSEMASSYVTNFLESDTGDFEFELPERGNSENISKSEPQTPSDCACLICGGNAGKHVHYGGQACYSCKAFFRRAVKDDVYKKFSCPTKSCKIDSKSWRSCKWCRFKKCIGSGLKPSWVLDKTERKRRREKKKTPAKAKSQPADQQQNIVATFINPATKSNNLVVSYSTDELMQIMTMAIGVHKDLTRNLMRFYGRNPTLFGHITSAIYHETIVPYDLYMKWETIWPNTAKDLVAKVSGLNTLCADDRIKLIRHNFPALQILLQSVLMENRQDFKASNMGETVQGSLLNQPPTENNEEDVKKLHEVLKGLNVGMQMPQNALTYEQVFTTPWASSIDLEERHAYIIPKLAAWPVDPKDPLQRVDKAMLFLIYNIIMLSTEGVSLADESKVRKLQARHFNMLYRYLNHKYKFNAETFFQEGMVMCRLGREAHEIRIHRLPV